MLKRVLVTGANGFIGQECCRVFADAGYDVTRAVRRIAHAPDGPEIDHYVIGDIGPETSWEQVLNGVDIVVHLAALTDSGSGLDIAFFRRCYSVNVLGTQCLARAAAKKSVKRFIYVSTIKVNGENSSTRPDCLESRFTESDRPNPRTSYALSKWAAELGLRIIATETGLEVVIVRPPLVYGPGVKGNFLHLMKWVSDQRPLPLGRVENARSLISLNNFIDFLLLCLQHPRAAGETFLVADDHDLSTPELVKLLAAALGVPNPLLRFPVPLISVVAKVVRKEEQYHRICGSLRIDSTKVRTLLGWFPPFSVYDEIPKVARWYQDISLSGSQRT